MNNIQKLIEFLKMKISEAHKRHDESYAAKNYANAQHWNGRHRAYEIALDEAEFLLKDESKQPQPPDFANTMLGEVPPVVNGGTEEHLMEVNSLFRSFHAIIEREGKDTNWDAIKKKVEMVLKIQHRMMYSDQYFNSNEPGAVSSRKAEKVFIGCTCKEEEKHGTTSIDCCNHCGKPTEDFWVNQ